MISRACGPICRHVRAVAWQLVEHFARHAPLAAGRRLHRRGPETLALGQDIDEGLAVEREAHRPPQLGIVERRLVAIDDQIGADAARRQLADRIRPLLLQVAGQRDRQRAGKGQLIFAGDKGEDRGRAVLGDRIFDAVEIGQPRFPVIRVSRHLDRVRSA